MRSLTEPEQRECRKATMAQFGRDARGQLDRQCCAWTGEQVDAFVMNRTSVNPVGP